MKTFKAQFSSTGTFPITVFIMIAFLLIFSDCKDIFAPPPPKALPTVVRKASPQQPYPPADLVLFNGVVYTADPINPEATALVITGNKITAVCEQNSEVGKYIRDKTRSIDLAGKFVTPGIIDGHVHFNSAGALIIDANLMTVSDKQGLRKEVNRVVDNNPCFLCRHDFKEWLANTAALKASGLNEEIIEGMEVGEDGEPTGIIFRPSPAFDRMVKAQKPKSHKRLLDENRAALQALREAGIVEVHDIARPDQTERFIELQENGELTCRVWLRPDLSRGAELKDKGLTMGLHPKTKKKDAWLRYGALFFEPYDDQPDNYGHWRRHTSDDPEYKTGNMEKMYNLIKVGLEAGFVPNVHAIGTRGVAEMLDLYERLKKEGIDLKGFRVIHAQVIRPQDFPRFKALNVIAEVNPYHLSDDMRWMEERIGHERCKGAYAFKSLLDSGAMLSFGSDWPGTSAALYHMHPKYLIYAAVARKTVKGTPKGGWFPKQRISVKEAIKAYTINNAYAAFEDDIRGSLVVGKLADITVFDRNLLKIPRDEILKTNVVYTIIDGKIVFEKK